jgi:ribosomal protein L37AE/L43A
MPPRPTWYEDNWKRMDKKTAREIRTNCPKCGSDKTYYNEKFKVWRCGKCENIFTIKGLKMEKPWWKRIFKKDRRTDKDIQ